MDLLEKAVDIRLGDLITVGSVLYKVEGIENDKVEEEITLTLKPNGKTYLNPDDFIYLVMEYQHEVQLFRSEY